MGISRRASLENRFPGVRRASVVTFGFTRVREFAMRADAQERGAAAPRPFRFYSRLTYRTVSSPVRARVCVCVCVCVTRPRIRVASRPTPRFLGWSKKYADDKFVTRRLVVRERNFGALRASFFFLFFFLSAKIFDSNAYSRNRERTRLEVLILTYLLLESKDSCFLYICDSYFVKCLILIKKSLYI